MEIIATAIIKGGTGKTVTAAAMVQAAAYRHGKVLAVDMDPQANLTFALKADQNRAGSYQVLHGTAAADVIQNTDQGVDVIAASPDLATETTCPASAKRLSAALEPVKRNYDLIVIDCPPQLGELTFNALQAATGLLVPLEADSASLQGLYQIAATANQIGHSNPRLKILGCVITRYNGRAKLYRYMRDVIGDTGKQIGAPLLGTVRQTVAVPEAMAYQVSLFEYAPRCTAARDYLDLYEKIMCD